MGVLPHEKTNRRSHCDPPDYLDLFPEDQEPGATGPAVEQRDRNGMQGAGAIGHDGTQVVFDARPVMREVRDSLAATMGECQREVCNALIQMQTTELHQE